MKRRLPLPGARGFSFVPLALVALAFAPHGFLGGAQAQAPDPKVPKETKELTEREKRIAEIFHAAQVTFDKDRITIVYDFESMDPNLAEDWQPKITPNNQRIRWARGMEGTMTTIEHGVILGDAGEWLHKAIFSSNVEVEADILPLSQNKRGNIMAAAFYNDKKKRAIGTNEGSQVVCLQARKHAKTPIPKTERTVVANERHKISFSYDGKALLCSYNGRKAADSVSSPKFTEGFDTGRVGLIWSGSVQYFLFKLTIQGKLDPAWLAAQLGESPPAAADGGKTKSAPASANAKDTKAGSKGEKGAGEKQGAGGKGER
jgi:hypothetical protein